MTIYVVLVLNVCTSTCIYSSAQNFNQNLFPNVYVAPLSVFHSKLTSFSRFLNNHASANQHIPALYTTLYILCIIHLAQVKTQTKPRIKVVQKKFHAGI